MRQRGRLTDRAVRHAKPATGKMASMIADGQGLYLQVSYPYVIEDDKKRYDHSRVNRSWIFRYQIDGTKRYLGLGALEKRTLAEAREEVHRLHQDLLRGDDPLDLKRQKKADRLAARAAAKRVKSFKWCAEEFGKSIEAGWTSQEHRRQWFRSLERYAYPTLDDLSVDCVTISDIISTLKPIWETKPETASRVRLAFAAACPDAALIRQLATVLIPAAP